MILNFDHDKINIVEAIKLELIIIIIIKRNNLKREVIKYDKFIVVIGWKYIFHATISKKISKNFTWNKTKFTWNKINRVKRRRKKKEYSLVIESLNVKLEQGLGRR